MTPSRPLITPSAARFDCGGCTACCRHFALGPVSDGIIQGLHAHGLETSWAPAAGGFAVQRPGPDGQPAWFLTRRDDGACVFLQDDGLCAVHRMHGADAKPAFCREYPFMVVEEPAATHVVVRADCGGWAESFEHGTPVADQARAIVELPRVHPPARFTMDPVPILPGLGIDPSQWTAVEQRLAPLFDREDEIEQTVSAAVDLLFALVGRPRPTPLPGRTDQATAFAAARLDAALGQAVVGAPRDDRDVRGMVAFLSEAHELVRSARPHLGQRRELSPSARAYLALVLRSELLGRSLQAHGGLPGWLGSVVLGTRLARAACPGEGAVDARTLGPRYATWVRLTRHGATQRLLSDLQPVLMELFLGAG